MASRITLIEQLGAVFRQRGYEGATLTQLAAAAGLSKASLYHNFPGGKGEMADVLLRDAVSRAERLCFSHLGGPEPPHERLGRFVDGFATYLEEVGGQCLLGVLALGSARPEHGERIATQFRIWQATLAGVFEECGQKPKRAARSAASVLDQLYGAQVAARLLGEPRHLRQSLKRLSRRLARPPL